MMKIAMRPQKTQLQSLYKFTAPGTGTFSKRNIAIMLGYKNFDVLVVGGAGGRSGISSGFAYDGNSISMGSNGGGGGGSKRVTDALANMPTSVNYTVGALGTPGTNVGVTVSPTSKPECKGGDGGDSSFGTIAVAGGGKGGNPVACWSNGGISATTGGGVGGTSTGSPAGGAGGITDDPPYTPSSAGVWNDSVKAGSGGGGGSGRDRWNGATTYGPTPASAGSSSGAAGAYSAPAEASPIGDSGGGGGGCNLAPLTGTNQYAGSGWNNGLGNGAVVLKLS
jgi:hypothetical protein